MCGRFTMTVDGDAIFEAFDWLQEPDEALFEAEPKWNRARYNIAPTQPVLVIGQRKEQDPTLAWFRWGLVPFWAKDPKQAARSINARIETVHTRNSFREPFKHRRCLIPADGWLEWEKQPKGAPKTKGRRPYLIRQPDEGLFTFAGIWDRWKTPDGGRLYTFSILTRDAEGPLADVHPRMPVLVPEDLRRVWLDPSVDVAKRDLREAVLAAPVPELALKRVSARVNSVAHDDPACLE